ncbi:MAG TPA: hypothetical protein VGM92_15185, partial [Candidatus Kapabacteria bacterium]
MSNPIVVLAAVLLASTIERTAIAQLSGSLSIGGQTTNNVQSLDTIAPDQMLMPAIDLNYDVHPSGVTTISLTGSYTPSFYNRNPALSFQETSLGATGLFYLSNQQDISAEAMEEGMESSLKPSRSSRLMRMEQNELWGTDFVMPSPVPLHVEMETKNDSLVDLAVSTLYLLSSALDSSEISPKGIAKARVQELEDLRDSISEVASTAADLLDSVGYSQSSAEVLVAELEHLRSPLAELLSHVTSPIDPSLLDIAIRLLEKATPEQDYLPTAPTPAAPVTATPQQKKLLQSLSVISTMLQKPSASAPVLTLVTSGTRLRSFGFNDIAVKEDADDSGATTMATALTVPVAYTNHAGVHYSPADSLLFGENLGGNPNDNKLLTFGAAVEGLTSTHFSLRGSYDYTHDVFPFDSVYSNTENRLTLMPRLGLGKSTVLFGEAAVGFRKYLTPLILTVAPAFYDTNVRTKKITLLRKAVIDTAGASFDQFSFGTGLSQFLGQDWVVGVLMAFNYNPNLRAYVTTADLTTGPKGKTVRAAAQIADDEYTYNLGRYTLFSDARIDGIDFGTDLSYEHRKYGSAVGKKGAVLDSGRVERGTFFNASVSKLFPFEKRW